MLGRGREGEVLDRLLDGVRGGRGGVLVVHGEAGVGKTALLEHTVEAARGFRIARTSGIEAEMELPFAAVQQAGEASSGCAGLAAGGSSGPGRRSGAGMARG